MGYQSSFELLSTAANSLAEWTNSTRNLLSGCFQCQRGSERCISNKETQGSQAWFDCEQLQTEQPFCYMNPLAMGEKEVISSQPKSQINLLGQPEVQNSTLDPPEGIPPRPLSSELNGGCAGWSLQCDETEKSFGQFTDSKVCQSTTDSQNATISPSFASQLEKDYFYRRNVLLRSGESFYTRSKRHSESSKKSTKVKSPLMHRKSWFENVNQHEEVDWDALTEGDEYEEAFRDVSFGDIWGTSELQDIFGTFNQNSFVSFGSVQSVLSSNFNGLQEKQKFVDVFPSYYSHHRNSKDSNYTSNYDQVDSIRTTNDQIKTSEVIDEIEPKSSFKENVIFLDKLKQLISDPFCSNKNDDIKNSINDLQDEFLICDKLSSDFSKSFNKKLLLNLVKEIVNECLISYSYSSHLCDIYPECIVQTKLMNILTFEYNFRDSDKLISDEIKNVRQKLQSVTSTNKNTKVPDKLFIENVASSEILTEEKQWNDYQKEETKIKLELFNDIFRDLVASEILVINSVLIKKCNSK